MKNCIYCRSEVPRDAPREHVIPQSFGVFKPDITLDCVCKDCNHHFGSNLEWPMRVQSLEGTLRLHYGFKGTVGGVGTDGVILSVAEGVRKGARTVVRTDKKGNLRTDLLTQVGARRDPSREFEWCLEKDLGAEFAERYPKGSEFLLLGGETPEDLDRLVRKWKEVCPTFVYGGTMNPPYGEKDHEGKVLLHAEHLGNRVKVRCLCKIAFNYMAFTCDPRFALSSSFDGMRAFIREDSGEGEGRAFVKNKPIIAQEIVHGQRITDGHVLTIDCRAPDRVVEVQVALFNSIHYRIPMCRDYLGHRFTRGHHFDVHTSEASELKTAIARPDFDPSSLDA
jgi:hypothetical protein